MFPLSPSWKKYIIIPALGNHPDSGRKVTQKTLQQVMSYCTADLGGWNVSEITIIDLLHAWPCQPAREAPTAPLKAVTS